MAKSTGARDRQRRREELLWGELTLRRVLLHLAESRYWSLRVGDRAEYRSQCLAYAYASAAYLQIVGELKAVM